MRAHFGRQNRAGAQTHFGLWRLDLFCGYDQSRIVVVVTAKIGFKNHHHGGFGYQRIFPIERWAFSDADLDACPTKKRTAKCVEPRAGNQSKRVAYKRLRFPRFAAPQTERILCRRIRPNRPTYPGLAGERKQSKIRNEESDGSACCLNLDNVSASVRGRLPCRVSKG